MPYQIFSGVYDKFSETNTDFSMFHSEDWRKHQLERLEKDDGYILTPLILGMAIQNKYLNILDWGGGVGRSGRTFKRASDLPVNFKIYDLDTGPLLRQNYDLIHFGSVLQYIENLESLKLPETRAIFISDAMIASQSFVTLQDWHGWKLPFKFRIKKDFQEAFFSFRLAAILPHESVINGIKGFYDTSNLPQELHPMGSYNLLFIKKGGNA